MKKSIFIESLNANDIEELYNLYYDLKRNFEGKQVTEFAIKLEINYNFV